MENEQQNSHSVYRTKSNLKYYCHIHIIIRKSALFKIAVSNYLLQIKSPYMNDVSTEYLKLMNYIILVKYFVNH